MKLIKVAAVIGHSSGDHGAYSPTLGEGEWTYNRRVAAHMIEEAPEYGLEVREFLRPSGSYSDAMREVYSQVNAWGAELSGELHFNSVKNTTANGTETFYWYKSQTGPILAQAIQDRILEVFGTRDRNIKKSAPKDYGYLAVYLPACPAALMEPFFGSNVADANKFKGYEAALGRCYLSAFRDAALALGMKPEQPPVQPPTQPPPIEPPTEWQPPANIAFTWADGVQLVYDLRPADD